MIQPARTRVFVNSNNVMGSRPDGWWRSCRGAFYSISAHRRHLLRNSPLLGIPDRRWTAYRSDLHPNHRARCRREPLRALREGVRDDARRHLPTRLSETRAFPPRGRTVVQGSRGTGSCPRPPAFPTCPSGGCAGSARMTSPPVRMPPLPPETESPCGPVRKFSEHRHSAHQRVRQLWATDPIP